MAQHLKKALEGPKAAPDAPNYGGYVDVWAPQAAALEARLNAPQQPLRTPEQIAQLRAENDRQYQLGMLAQLSGDENLQGLGGQIFKQALAGRQPKQTEKGVLDPFTGQFTYNPEYQQEMTQAQLNRINTMRAEGYQRWLSDRQRAEEQGQRDRQHMEALAAIKQMGSSGGSDFGGVAQQVGVDATGNPFFRHKDSGRLFRYGPDGAPQWVTPGQPSPVQAAPGTTGAAAPLNAPGAPFIHPKPSSAEPSIDERQAAGWTKQATLAFDQMKQALQSDPGASQQPLKELFLTSIPGVGEKLNYAAMSPARQRFTVAASDFAEAALRAATGAGVNRDEAIQKIRVLTPQWGEDPATTADKQRRMQVYLESLTTRAGRALPATPSSAPAGASNNDPWGIR